MRKPGIDHTGLVMAQIYQTARPLILWFPSICTMTAFGQMKKEKPLQNTGVRLYENLKESFVRHWPRSYSLPKQATGVCSQMIKVPLLSAFKTKFIQKCVSSFLSWFLPPQLNPNLNKV